VSALIARRWRIDLHQIPERSPSHAPRHDAYSNTPLKLAPLTLTPLTLMPLTLTLTPLTPPLSAENHLARRPPRHHPQASPPAL